MRLRGKKRPEPRRRVRPAADAAGSSTAQSQPAFSYHARRSDQPANTGRRLPGREAVRAHSKRFGNFWLQRFGLLVLLLVIIAAAVNILSLSTQVKVLPLDRSSQALLQPSDVYAQAAEKLLAGSFWNRNKITVDTAKISSQLEREFPELAGVSITLPLMAHQPIVYVQPAQPALILITQGGGSYIVDTAGTVLLATASASDGSRLTLPIVTDHSGLTATIGRQVLSSTSVGFIQTVAAQLAAKKVSIASMTLPSGTNELDVQISGQPYYVKFNLANDDPTQQAGTYLAVRAQLAKQNVTPSQYVDVRVDGRAYYK